MKFNNINIIYNGKHYSQTDYEQFVSSQENFQKDFNQAIILMHRTPSLLFSICMCIENNITYIPIDPTCPQSRISYIIENSEASFIFNDTDMSFTLPPDKVGVRLKNNLMYIIYTSGSGGVPKGVEITKKGILNFIDGVSKVIEFSRNKRIACLSTVSFDIFFLESIMALYKGLTVVLANSNEQQNPKLMANFIESNEIDMIQMTPSRMQLLINYDKDLVCLHHVKEILIGGEQFPISLLRKLQQIPQVKIYNLYGPTETTIWSTVSNLTGSKDVNIGQPIINTKIYIIDKNLNILGQEQVGEICIAGEGLANGYYGKNTLTSEKFITLPRFPDIKIFRTGDLGKHLQNGNYSYLGRIDNQIKFHGYRIELEEIENVLKQHSAITHAVVREVSIESYKILEALYMSDKVLSANTLKQFLLKKLPEYMVPAKYTKVAEFIYLPNGKIDRNSLNALDLVTSKPHGNMIPLQDNYKTILKSIQKVLKEKSKLDVDANTNLLCAGIDSISFITIVVKLEAQFKFEFDDNMLLVKAFPTIGAIIDYVALKISEVRYEL